jgi:hypothetical protein
METKILEILDQQLQPCGMRFTNWALPRSVRLHEACVRGIHEGEYPVCQRHIYGSSTRKARLAV